MPVRYRWAHRRPQGRMLWRWLILVVTPYGLVPFLGAALMTPSLLLWGLTSPKGLSVPLPDNHLGLGIALACVLAAVCCFGGPRVATFIARRRRTRLQVFLENPTRG
jgi:hypothetical protein